MRLPRCCVGVVLLVATAVAPAQEQEPAPRPDPVGLLRQALRAPLRDAAARDKQLREVADRLRGLDDLRRGLLLNEWRDHDPDEAVAAVDARHRQALVDRFQRGVRAALRQDGPDGRLATLKMIGELDAPLARDFAGDLAELLRGGSAALRTAAARALGRIAPEPAAAAAALAGLLKDPDPAVRAAAAEALGELVTAAGRRHAARENVGGHDEVIAAACAAAPAAAGGMADASTPVRRRCAEALGAGAAVLVNVIADPAAAGEVEDWAAYQHAVEDERTAVRPLALALCQQCATLARASGDADAAVRILARHALEDVAGARVRLLHRASSIVAAPDGAGDRAAAARSAAYLLEDPLLGGLRQAVPALAAGLDDPDVEGRRATIDVLEALGRHAAAAAPALIAALSDRDRFVRWAAARALGKVRPANAEAAVSSLARLLGDPDSDVRLAAATALGAYGPAARAALPALLEASHAPEAETRTAVAQALENIGSDDGARQRPR